MNHFETLMAPTCCSTKELARISSALESVSVETKQKCRTELLMPTTRVYDELTTVRTVETYDGADNGYALFCQSLTGSMADPIPIGYAGAWFMALLRANRLSAFTADMKAAALVSAAGASDAWFFQGAAAIARCVAINAETEQLTQAKSAWKAAIDYYEEFFRIESVNGSHAHTMLSDAKQKEDCAKVWNHFLCMQADETAERLQYYITCGETNGLNIAIGVLSMPDMKKYRPGLFEKTLSKLTLPYKNAIRNALNLDIASELYTNCPAIVKKNDLGNELLIAMLEALRKECGRVGKGHGNFESVLQWSEKLDVCSLAKGHSALVMAGAESFFEECAEQIRNQINEIENSITAAQARSLRRIMPKDFIIARQIDGTEITVELLAEIDLREQVAEEIQKNKAGTQAGYTSLGKKIWRIISEGTKDADKRSLLVNIALGELTKNNPGNDNIGAFLTPFPDSVALGSDQFKTVGDLKAALGKRDLSQLIAQTIEDCSIWSMQDARNVGVKVWGMIEPATSDRSQRSSYAIFAFNALCKKTDKKDNLVGFLTAFPAELPIKGVNGIDTIGELMNALFKAYQQETTGVSQGYGSTYVKKNKGKSKARSFFAFILGFLCFNLMWAGPVMIAPLFKGISVLQVIVIILSFVPMLIFRSVMKRKQR